MVYCGPVIVVCCHGLQERRPTAGSVGVADFSVIHVKFFRVFDEENFRPNISVME